MWGVFKNCAICRGSKMSLILGTNCLADNIREGMDLLSFPYAARPPARGNVTLCPQDNLESLLERLSLTADAEGMRGRVEFSDPSPAGDDADGRHDRPTDPRIAHGLFTCYDG